MTGGLALLLLTATATVVMPLPAPAQAQDKAKEKTKEKAKDKAAGVFDDEKTTPEEKKAKEKEKEKEKAKKATATERDSIGFTQENVAAQMTELEERMFRLSEALRGLEPENASRLRLALKFSREEQILDQMRETHKLMKEAQLSKAETEVRELVAKLEHLRNLLLAEDLDFQLKVARLRQMREALGQLDRIIKEERRELGWSRFAIEQRKRLDRLAARRPDLETLARDQKAVIADTKDAPPSGEAVKATRAAIRDREVKVRNAANALATDPLFADLQPPHLRRADAYLGDAVSALEGTAVDAAIEAEEKALGMIDRELTRFDDRSPRRSRRSPGASSGVARGINRRTEARRTRWRKSRRGWETPGLPSGKT